MYPASQASPSETVETLPPFVRTILFAEDHEDLRTVTTYFLESMGFVVIACGNAELAMQAFQAQPAVDVLLTDLQMPGRSGVELARELTRLRPFLPVLIVSGSLPTEELLAELENRRWAFLSKPCGLSSLAGTIRDLITADRKLAA